MKCPIDNETLVITERSGVEIEYCPRYRGVWLDRGELDKIIEGSGNGRAARYDPGAVTRQRGYKPKKMESFISELFDF